VTTFVVADHVYVFFLELKLSVAASYVVHDYPDDCLNLSPYFWIPVVYVIGFDQSEVNIDTGDVLAIQIVERSLLALESEPIFKTENIFIH
jgi:hypothetical protein